MHSFSEKLRRISTSPRKVAKKLLRCSSILPTIGRQAVTRVRQTAKNEYVFFNVSQKFKSAEPHLNFSCNLDSRNSSFIPTEAVLANSEHSTSSKKSLKYSSSKDLMSLPDQCILQVINRLNFTDICNLRLVNKRLDLIIQRHAAILPKNHRADLTIYGTSTGSIDFEKSSRSHCSKLADTSLKYVQLDKPLRHIVFDYCLYVEGVLFNPALRHALQRSQRNCLYEINLNNCHVNISSIEFASFMAHTGLQKLSIYNCSFENHLTISDDVFTFYRNLQTFSIYSDSMQTFPNLTSNTLNIWSKTKTWPTLLALDNIQCSFNIASIAKMIKSYIRWCYSDSANNFCAAQSILWNFGIVNVSAGEAKILLKAIGTCVTLIKSRDSLVSVRVRCHDHAPPLFVRFQCINVFANLV